MLQGPMAALCGACLRAPPYVPMPSPAARSSPPQQQVQASAAACAQDVWPANACLCPTARLRQRSAHRGYSVPLAPTAHTSALHNCGLVAHLGQHCVHRRYQEPLRDSDQHPRTCNGCCVAGGPRREQGSSAPEGKGHHQHWAAAIALGCRAPRDLQATASSHGHKAWCRAGDVISIGWLCHLGATQAPDSCSQRSNCRLAAGC